MQITDSDNAINMMDLSDLEDNLKLVLPKEYKEFLLKNNGGYVTEFLCTPNFIEVDPLTQKKYHQATNADKFNSLAEIEEDVADNKEDPVFPFDYIPIAYDSGGNVILLKATRDAEYGSIFFANHELYKDGFYVLTKIAPSFNEFIESLTPFEESDD